MAVTQTDILYQSSLENYQLAARVCYPTGASNLPVVVVMHGFGQQVSSFDSAAYERFAQGRYLDLTSVTGAFIAAETITGGTSGATATVSRAINATMKRIVCAGVTGTFEAAETITGAASAATATVTTVTATECFAVFVEMRGRGISAGNEDAGAREIYDIVDAVNYVLTNYASATDAAQVHLVGYSGGGGNGFSCASKFPDFWNSITTFFGMSDYGYDGNSGWYYTASSDTYRVQLRDWVGGPPTDYLDRYHARASVLAIANYSGGQLTIHHDAADLIVPVAQGSNVAAAMDAASLTNYDYKETAAGDNPRWLHALPDSNQQVNLAEVEFMGPISAKTHGAWTVATADTLAIAGYLITKLFGIFLGTGGTSDFGSVTYNTATPAWTITIDTAGTRWNLYFYNQTPAATVAVTVNSVGYSAVVDANGTAYYSNKPVPVAIAFRLPNALRPGVR